MSSSTYEAVVLYIGLGLSGLGLLLNVATAVGFVVAVARRPNFTAGWCVAAMAAADSLVLALFVLPWLQGLGWGLSDSGYVNFCLPVFFVHFASAFSAWVLFLLSFFYYLMVWRPLDFATRDWVRRPGGVLLATLTVCVGAQLYIPFTLEYKSEHGTCVESFGIQTGNWLLLLDWIVNFLVPTVASLALSVPALMPPGLHTDKMELALLRDGDRSRTGSGVSADWADAARLTSGATREAHRLSEGRRKLRWLALLAAAKLLANVPSQAFRVLDTLAPSLRASKSAVFPVAYLMYYAQFCGQALFVFFLFAFRSKRKQPVGYSTFHNP